MRSKDQHSYQFYPTFSPLWVSPLVRLILGRDNLDTRGGESRVKLKLNFVDFENLLDFENSEDFKDF